MEIKLTEREETGSTQYYALQFEVEDGGKRISLTLPQMKAMIKTAILTSIPSRLLPETDIKELSQKNLKRSGGIYTGAY